MAKDKDDYPLSKTEIVRHQAYLEQTILYMEKDDMAKNFLVSILGKITGKLEQLEQKNSANMTQDVETKAKEVIVEKIVYQDKIVEKRVEVPVEKIVEMTPNWAKSLQAEFEFLQQVQSYPKLNQILLPNSDDNVLPLIVIASQWNNVLRVWDELALQVKNSQKPLTTTELAILKHCLALFNLSLSSHQASLKSPEIGSIYDYDKHQKVSGSGSTISEVLLAGLYNAAGDQVRAAIVVTQ